MPDQHSTQSGPVTMTEALGQSETFIYFQEQISKVAPIDRPVLVLGERGTGKELAASRIHYLSKRWDKPFVTLNCSALTPSLIESELFGYEKGAFSGAVSQKTGRFETASGGTLFLDEIGTIPMEVQEKILRVVEYGRFERVGASIPIHVDVRIVAATNVDLAAMAKAGRFKQDLLDRLSFEVIYVPPLRLRREDIALLAHHFAARMAFELEYQDLPQLSSGALKALEAYPWPGNIRELKNVVERAVYKSASGRIREISFDPFDHPYQKTLERPKPISSVKTDTAPDISAVENESENPIVHSGGQPPDSPLDQPGHHSGHPLMSTILKLPLKQAVGELEKYRVSKALSASRFNQKQAAAKLGLTYDQLRGLLRKHSLK